MRLDDLRRHVIAAQGFATRHRKASADDVEACVRRLSCVQLDSISVVDRSHRLALASRVGATSPDVVSKLLGSGRLFEHWAHEACILPIEDWPLFRRRMRERVDHHWWGPVIAGDPALARRVLREAKAHGPIRASHFEGRSEGMWVLKPEKRMLDALWTAGKLVVSGREGFQRLYDLPERVVPERYRKAPVATERAWHEGLVLRAVRARGALTLAGILEHYRLRPERVAVRAAIARLLRRGEIHEHEVEDDGVVYAVGAIGSGRAPTASVLLSPFDNLLWDRPFARRVLGFDHIIEVYKKPHQRAYGYYTMPLVSGDRFVGRADLKSDREAGVLLVRSFHREKGVRASDADDAFAKALEMLSRALSLHIDSSIVR